MHTRQNRENAAAQRLDKSRGGDPWRVGLHDQPRISVNTFRTRRLSSAISTSCRTVAGAVGPLRRRSMTSISAVRIVSPRRRDVTPFFLQLELESDSEEGTDR